MAQKLLIVESPTKIKSYSKYLDNSFQVLASNGHLRDLIPKTGAIDTNDNFTMHYQIIERNQKNADAICKAFKNADVLYLASDPDREGEAIAWHIYSILKEKNLLKNKTIYRMTSNEITKAGITDALSNVRAINMDLVNAQQARRALDYLVGFNLSPLLWSKVERGLSAGRVQSPALRLIVEREQSIENFKSTEYWSIKANLIKEKNNFVAKLVQYKNEKLQQYFITNEMQANEIKDDLLSAAKGKLLVSSVNKTSRSKSPQPPFTTSTLQQEANKKLKFSAKYTMQIAQELYEGINLSNGTLGLITYMRTDSVNISNEFMVQLRQFIQLRYPNQSSSDLRIFKTKTKNAQEAHEAIRPTTLEQEPFTIKKYLTDDQFKLYDLIWQRTLASQMKEATIEQVAIDLICGDATCGNIFRLNGSIVADHGFMQVYKESNNEKTDPKAALDATKELPPLIEGEELCLDKIDINQHFTEPPSRFTEALLVKTLEEHGIGRPSTYAAIINTLEQRKYVTLVDGKFKPTAIGSKAINFLTSHFKQYIDYDFTALLEDQLDAIARGENSLISVLQDFWQPFIKLINDTNEKIENIASETPKSKPTIVPNRSCPNCQKHLVIKVGKHGKFIACSGYPTCKYTAKEKIAQS